MDELLSPEQVAERLQVTPKTIREWLRSGDLVGVKLGKAWRIHEADVRRLLDEQFLTARIRRASRMHPDRKWGRGYCRECGSLMPEPQESFRRHWVCSAACKDAYDMKADAVVGRGTLEFAECAATVVPPY